MKQNHLAVKAFLYFSWNYHSVDDFIGYICEKTNNNHIKAHLLNKFDEIYDAYGSHAAVTRFYAEIDSELRDALVDYACKVYYPQGFSSDKEGIALLAE